MTDYKTITDYISEQTNPYNSSGLPLPPPPPQTPVATLRDQFAMAALTHGITGDSFTSIAESAYKLADAMMEARK
jgi:hypothetical protein